METQTTYAEELREEADRAALEERILSAARPALEDERMETITLEIGSETTIDGCRQDNLRPVTFEGEEVGSRHYYTDERGTRGVNETLYRTADGGLVVYVEDWSRWQGEISSCKLVRVRPADLDVGGRFEMLGRACNMARPLTLAEALEQSDDEH